MAMNKQRFTSNLLNILNYDDAGNIVLRDYSQTIRYNWNGTIHAFTGPLSISSIAAAVTDTDRFLVSDGSVLKYRTGAEVLSDIGGQAALGYTPVPTTRTLTINGTTFDLSADRSWTIAAGITGSGVAGQVAYWNGTSSQTGSNNLFWDNTNGRLGIGTNAPAAALDSRTTSGFIVAAFKSQYAVTGYISTDNGGVWLGVGADGYRTCYIADSSNNSLIYRVNNVQVGRIFNTGNLVLQNGGTFTDSGQRLQVIGDAFIRGSGATSATTALTVQNSSGFNILTIANNAQTTLRGNTAFDGDNAINIINGNNASMFSIWNSGIVFVNYVGGSARFNIGARTFVDTGTTFEIGGNVVNNILNSGDGGFSTNFIRNGTFGGTNGNTNHVNITANFAPSNGNGFFYNSLRLNPTINQTGGSNGITRGLLISPTLTAAADWRSIEWSNNSGWGLYGAGTAPNFLGGNLTVSRNQNASTNIIISNTTSGTGASSEFRVVTNIGFSSFGKLSTLATTYKTIASNDAYLFNDSFGGDISILNDVAAGKIKFAAGASSTAQMTLTAAGRLLLGTVTEGTFLLDVNGTARVGGPSISAQLYLKGGSGLGQYLYLDNGGSDLWTIIGANVFVIDSSSTRIFRANANAQVTINGSSVNNSAQLQVDSTTRGFLPPRMTTTQKNAISSPAAGLQVYDTTLNKSSYYNGTAWVDGDVTGSGTYTPTVTVVSGGATSVTSNVARYIRVGNVVTVYGVFFYQPSGSGAVETNNEFTITLPITRTVTTNFASGTVSFSTVSGVGNQSQGYLFGTATTTISLFAQNWWSGSGANAYYTFSYEIN